MLGPLCVRCVARRKIINIKMCIIFIRALCVHQASDFVCMTLTEQFALISIHSTHTQKTTEPHDVSSKINSKTVDRQIVSHAISSCSCSFCFFLLLSVAVDRVRIVRVIYFELCGFGKIGLWLLISSNLFKHIDHSECLTQTRKNDTQRDDAAALTRRWRKI